MGIFFCTVQFALKGLTVNFALKGPGSEPQNGVWDAASAAAVCPSRAALRRELANTLGGIVTHRVPHPNLASCARLGREFSCD
jgi:hypothetical protein